MCLVMFVSLLLSVFVEWDDNILFQVFLLNRKQFLYQICQISDDRRDTVYTGGGFFTLVSYSSRPSL